MSALGLFITPAARDDIQAVITHAQGNKIDLVEMRRRMGSDELADDKAPGRDKAFCCTVPDGLKCVFSIEQHPCGWCRHLSVSQAGKRRPHSLVLEELMSEFGFHGGLEQATAIWQESISLEQVAVNVLQTLDVTAGKPIQYAG